MIYCEQYRAEEISELDTYILFQRNEAESPKEKFFQERILGGYFALRGVIDFSGVTSSLTSGMGITADNFVWVAIYISIMNSFLEEFFFRGFGFITLKKYVNVRFAYFFSPVLFAIYHVGMLVGMFHPAVLALLMFGLIVGGLIFNALNDKLGNIYPSWFVHMAANFAINTIGVILFGVI